MARTGKPKLSDAIRKGAPKEVKAGHGPSPRGDAEQLREAGENCAGPRRRGVDPRPDGQHRTGEPTGRPARILGRGQQAGKARPT